ncbi:hypothetical protein [Marinomonas atlantica]|uniref:hypothetical protein n=1 Tax=Marinomonas atlantica TaxID=1806668 RepID=UPI00082EB258|nr:hypothetical protein [Marinomonas atlantica]
MDTIEIQIQGSQPEPYQVEILKHTDHELEIACDCPAGKNGTHCKHRIEVLTGSYEDVIYDEATIDQLKKLEGWIAGTKVEAALKEVITAEQKLDEYKKLVKNAKRKLARIMEGG